MIITSHRQPSPSPKLIAYLQQKVGISESALNLGIRQSEIEQAPLPIVLWSFGLISLAQLQVILDLEF